MSKIDDSVRYIVAHDVNRLLTEIALFLGIEPEELIDEGIEVSQTYENLDRISEIFMTYS